MSTIFHHIRWVALLFAASMIGVGFSRTVLGIEEPLSPVNGIRVIVVGLFVFLGFTKNPRIHEAAVFVAGALFVLSMAISFLQRT